MGKLNFALLFCGAVLSTNIFADVTGYITPERNSALDRDIYRALTLAGIARLHRPYRLIDIEMAIAAIRQYEPALAARVAREIGRQDKVAALDSAHLTAYSKDISARPNAQGASGQGQYEIGIEAHWQMASWLRVNGGVTEGEAGSSFAGTLLSLGGVSAQLDIGYKPYWLSPMQGHSQLLSTQAEAVPSVSLSNPEVINTWGVRWNYEIAVAQLSEQMTAFNGGFDDSRGPLLAIFHLSLQPTDWWVLGATRNFQFGGGERELSAKTLARAFYDPRGADNDASVDEESGNQVAALSSQMHFAAPWPFTFNLEIAGEDTSNNKEYQLGNPAISAGLYFPSFGVRGLGATFEYAQWDSGWYVNNVYQEGYSHDGYILGHWAMQPQHEIGSAAPASSRYVAFDYVVNEQHSFVLNGRMATHEIATLKRYRRFDAEYTWSPSNWQFSVGVTTGEDSFGESLDEARVALRWR